MPISTIPRPRPLAALRDRVARRLKKHDILAAGSVHLKLRTADFKILTRSRKLSTPTQLAEILFRQGIDLAGKRDRRPQISGCWGSAARDLRPAGHGRRPRPGRSRTGTRRRRLERVMNEIRRETGTATP